MSGGTERETFVLVHGASHGGWCWVKVADRLRARGHRVYTPTLTGLADRSHVAEGVNLSTHVADVANLLKWEDLQGVVLCGHSYGGMVISGAAETAPAGAIGAMVFLDAFLPADGRSVADYMPGVHAALQAEVARTGAAPIPSAAIFGINEADAAWAEAKLTPQPVATALEPARMTGARERIGCKAYVLATGPTAEIFPMFRAFAAEVRDRPDWRYYEAACNHDVMLDDPDRVVEILEDVAQARRA